MDGVRGAEMTRAEIDWTFKNQYRPRMCGLCRHYDKENAKRDKDNGLLMAKCMRTGRMVARTDWCLLKTERREHIRAMLMYRGQNDGFA